MNVSTDSEWTTNDFDVVIPSLIILVDDLILEEVCEYPINEFEHIWVVLCRTHQAILYWFVVCNATNNREVTLLVHL